MTIYLCWMAAGFVLAGLLFLSGCLCAGHWKYMNQYKLEERLRSNDNYIKPKSINTDLLERNTEGTYTFYVTKGGAKAHITDRCSGLSQSHDRKTIQKKDLCHLCFNKLVNIKNH